MVKNAHQCSPKPKITSLNVLFYPQPKNHQFTVTEEEKKSDLKIWNSIIGVNYQNDDNFNN